MHKTARQRHVLDILSEQGQASITELAEKLQVSADTIRRDLTDLENQGLAQKNHGGAIALNLSAMNRQGRNTLLPDAHWIVADHLKVNRCEPYLGSGLSNIQQLCLDRPWPELGDPGALQVTVCAN